MLQILKYLSPFNALISFRSTFAFINKEKYIRLLILLIFFAFQPFCYEVQAMGGEEEEDHYFCLSRSILNDEGQTEEVCRYYQRNSNEITGSILKFEGDVVYGPLYTNLNAEIQKQLDFVEKRSGSTFDVNFLTAILSVTGHKGAQQKRLYTNLHARKKKNGFVQFTTEEGSVAMFSSANYDVLTHEGRKSFNLQARVETLKKKGIGLDYLFLNKDSPYLPEDFPRERHTEPLCLKALHTLPENAFQKLLPDEYTLDYYEIHFISARDACGECMQKVYESITSLKVHFHSSNLFVFFHSVQADSPYIVKLSKSLSINGKFRYEHFDVDPDDRKKLKKPFILQKRPDVDFQSIPSYYIGILRYLEKHGEKFDCR